MTSSRVTPLPFAFLLALAAEANGNASALLPDARERLEPGKLSGLLNRGGAPEFTVKSIEQIRDGEKATVVQYFPNFPNFRNCFSGYWRNC